MKPDEPVFGALLRVGRKGSKDSMGTSRQRTRIDARGGAYIAARSRRACLASYLNDGELASNRMKECMRSESRARVV